MAGKKGKKTKVVPLVAKDNNGKITYTYYVRKNLGKKSSDGKVEKLSIKKYNPRTRKHEIFKEGKPQKSS